MSKILRMIPGDTVILHKVLTFSGATGKLEIPFEFKYVKIENEVVTLELYVTGEIRNARNN